MSGYRRFRAFLRQEGCEAAFDRAFYSFNGFTHLDESLWEVGDEEFVVAHAFDWRETAEGREFWLEIDRRWSRLLGSGHIL